MLDAEEEAAGVLLTAADVVGTTLVAGAALVGAAVALVGTGADVAVAVELLVDTVGACGCPSTVWVTGAIIVWS